MTQPVRADANAREARERAELAAANRDSAQALEACSLLAELFRSGYRLTALAEPAAIPAKPVRMRARFEGSCAECSAPIAPNDFVFWTRGVQGIECATCGVAK